MLITRTTKPRATSLVLVAILTESSVECEMSWVLKTDRVAWLYIVEAVHAWVMDDECWISHAEGAHALCCELT